MKRHLVLVAVVLVLAVFGGSPVEGSPITYYFSGTVPLASGSLEALKGTPVSGWLLYDPAWPLVPPQVIKYSIPGGTVSLTTAYGNSVSTPGSVYIGRAGGMSPDVMAISFDWVEFDESSAHRAADFVLRGPGGFGPYTPPPFPPPPDLAGFAVHKLFFIWGSSGLAQAEVGCFSADARECGLTPIPEPASLFLFGAGLVGLRAWRKRRQ